MRSFSTANASHMFLAKHGRVFGYNTFEILLFCSLMMVLVLKTGLRQLIAFNNNIRQTSVTSRKEMKLVTHCDPCLKSMFKFMPYHTFLCLATKAI